MTCAASTLAVANNTGALVHPHVLAQCYEIAGDQANSELPYCGD